MNKNVMNNCSKQLLELLLSATLKQIQGHSMFLNPVTGNKIKEFLTKLCAPYFVFIGSSNNATMKQYKINKLHYIRPKLHYFL